MTEHAYKTPAEFDRALKKAAKAADGDTGERYRQALRDRFLCRVFADPGERFVLKGGSGMLARVPNARTTRDADFALRKKEAPDKIVATLEDLLAADMGDFCRFELTGREESMDDNGYSRLLKLRYATYIGDEEKDPVLVDLSLDCELMLPPDKITPANRLDVPDVIMHDYCVYSVADQLADKMCAIMERQRGGWASSRMKDLTDVVTYALSQRFALEDLADAVMGECRRRGMDTPKAFAAPEEWQARYAAFAQKAGSPAAYQSFDNASFLASKVFNPALGVRGDCMEWNPETLEWDKL